MTHVKGDCSASDDCEGGDYCYCDEPCDCSWTESPKAEKTLPINAKVFIEYLILCGYEYVADRYVQTGKAYVDFGTKKIFHSPKDNLAGLRE